MEKEPVGKLSFQHRLHEVIYESDTAAGKAFDVSLLILIIASIVVVILDSVGRWHLKYGQVFWVMEWGVYSAVYH